MTAPPLPVPPVSVLPAGDGDPQAPGPGVPRTFSEDNPLLTARHVDNLVESIGNMSRHTAILVDVQRRIAADGKASRVGVEKLNDSTQELATVTRELATVTRELGKSVQTLVTSNKDLIESNTRLMRVLKGEKTCEETTPSGRRKRG